MSDAVRNLEPRALWNHFADLNAIPRPSKKEERVIQFMVEFGRSLNLETEIDAVRNVVIRKPATAGMENRTPVILQSHLDMVHQKNNDTVFDFEQEGIRMRVNGDWVDAEGTTLGADNGIGVATIMALLAADDIVHPPLEALFTIDEETGMTGALELKKEWLKGKILLNLDTEEDNELTIGCAGGIDVTASGTYPEEQIPAGHVAFRLTVKGLSGGHSGMDIHKGLANANKLLIRLLYRSHERFGLRIAQLDGGSLRNAIPREAWAWVTLPAQQADAFARNIAHLESVLKAEFGTTDPNLKLVWETAEAPAQVMQEEFQDRLLAAIYTCPNGIYRMSPDITGLVQTSNNVARLIAKSGEVTVMCLTRSSLDSEKEDLAHAIEACFSLADLTVTRSGSYPGWQPRPGSAIVELMHKLYRELFTDEPKVMACHAGLECGIIGGSYPALDMVSFGPNIRGAHSPDERVQISSVQKYWSYVLETLARIPVSA
jgi:dipeptidase D